MQELGSGSSTKTKTLIRSILNQKGKLLYIPIDISESMLKESSQSLLQEFPSLKIVGVAAEYSAGLRLIHERYSDRTKLILWLGSSIGNLPRKEATKFLASVRESMTVNDRILIGMDLKKDIKELLAAYNDSLGVTAEFNNNMLVRINNDLQANFRYDKFEHRSVWNPSEGRIEMHLFSKEDHNVNIEGLDLVLHFSKGESIHTENSHKFVPRIRFLSPDVYANNSCILSRYDQNDIETTASSSGFVVSNQWFDADHKFSLNLFAPLTSSS
jgi:dimethylhistidine N-methyltransferase